MFHGNDTLSSFQLARGYAPSNLGIPSTVVPQLLLDAHIEITAARALQTLLRSKASSPVHHHQISTGMRIWVYTYSNVADRLVILLCLSLTMTFVLLPPVPLLATSYLNPWRQNLMFLRPLKGFLVFLTLFMLRPSARLPLLLLLNLYIILFRPFPNLLKFLRICLCIIFLLKNNLRNSAKTVPPPPPAPPLPSSPSTVPPPPSLPPPLIHLIYLNHPYNYLTLFLNLLLLPYQCPCFNRQLLNSCCSFFRILFFLSSIRRPVSIHWFRLYT